MTEEWPGTARCCIALATIGQRQALAPAPLLSLAEGLPIRYKLLTVRTLRQSAAAGRPPR